MAEGMVDAIGDNSADLLKARRAGVLWRAAQACVRLGLKPITQGKLLRDIAAAVLAGHTGAPPPLPRTSSDNGHIATEDEQGGGDKLASPPSDAYKSARAWVPALLSARLPGEGGLDRLFLNVTGARIVQNALLFDPPVAAPVLKAVAALPEALLAAVARDNIGSRCLLDPILEAAGNRGAGGDGKGGGKGKNKPAEDARRTVLRAFRGHLVAMACDRVAWHVLLKCFRGADMKDKRYVSGLVLFTRGRGEALLVAASGALYHPASSVRSRLCVYLNDNFCRHVLDSIFCFCWLLQHFRRSPECGFVYVPPFVEQNQQHLKQEKKCDEGTAGEALDRCYPRAAFFATPAR